MSHNLTAKRVREHKEQNPHLYCPKCLFRTNGTKPCPAHAAAKRELTHLSDESLSMRLDFTK